MAECKQLLCGIQIFLALTILVHCLPEGTGASYQVFGLK